MSPIGNEFRLWRPLEAGARLRSYATWARPVARVRTAAGALSRGRLGEALDGAFGGALGGSLGGAVRRAARDPFARPEGAPRAEALRERLLARPEARLTYVILFTPRSGSSRLHEVLAATRRLGNPGEAFNPGFLPGNAERLGARDLEDYVALLRRARSLGGVMGFEATLRHLRATFGDGAAFARIVRPDAWVWLVREDIVAQAVSISRMVQTDLHHARPGTPPEALAAAERRFAYRPADIAARLAGLRRLEIGSEAMMASLGAAPLRLSHERVLAMEPRAAAERVAAHLGVALPARIDFALTHARLGTGKSEDFALRFRRENPGLVARIDRARAPMIEALA